MFSSNPPHSIGSHSINRCVSAAHPRPPTQHHPHTPLPTTSNSLGGFLAARYAELHPDRVERLVLLCPGFDRCSRWEKLFGAEALREWERVGWRAFEVGIWVCVLVFSGAG